MKPIWLPALSGKTNHSPVSKAVRAVLQLLAADWIAVPDNVEEIGSLQIVIDSSEEFGSDWIVTPRAEAILNCRVPATVFRFSGGHTHEWLLAGSERPRVVENTTEVLRVLMELVSAPAVNASAVGIRRAGDGLLPTTCGEPLALRLQRVDLLLSAPATFQAALLHDYGKAKPRETAPQRIDAGIDRLTDAQALAWRRLRGSSGERIRVLVVDNATWREVYDFAPDQWDALLSDSSFEFYFHEFENAQQIETWRCGRLVGVTDTATLASERNTVDWTNLDVILQDIHLGSGQPLGYDLTSRYFALAPQAMVFLLTSMAVEALAASGVTLKVDRVLSKRHVLGLGWEYRQRFNELFGALLWPAWRKATQSDSFSLTSTESLRHLFGSIRRWTFEPEILFHGSALPEMIEHSYRHTRAVWDLAQDILAPLLAENRHSSDSLTDEEKVLLCLGIWMHDVGHVGDEHFVESTDIRPMHGSISDRHLLRNPGALGLEWLLEGCTHEECAKAAPDHERLKRMNCSGDCLTTGAAPCPVRCVGLLARYHQQSAPIYADSLPAIVDKAKPLTPYCRVRLVLEGGRLVEKSDDAEADVHRWMNRLEPLGWDAHTVRLLKDFNGGSLDLVKTEVLLRWLDALQLGVCRVGSTIRAETMRNYLSVRQRHVARRVSELERDLNQHGSYDERGMEARSQLDALNYYEQLLDAQDVHHWLHSSVRRITLERQHGLGHRLVFELDEVRVMELSNVLIRVFKNTRHESADSKTLIKLPPDAATALGIAESPLDAATAAVAWATLVGKEFINSELDGHAIADVATLGGLVADIFSLGKNFYWYRIGETVKPIAVKDAGRKKVASSEGPDPERSSAQDRSRSILLDCDPGIDDAMGIAMASQLFGSVTLSITAGNVPREQCVMNAALTSGVVAASHGSKNPSLVFRGAAASLRGDRPSATSVHGRDGLGEVPLLPGKRPTVLPVPVNGGIGQILKLAQEKPAPLFVFTGPLTNLALALLEAEDPVALIEGLGRVVVMGGAFGVEGNITPVAEFNTFFDPEALRVVLRFYQDYQQRPTPEQDAEAPTVGLFFVGLDVTERVQLSDKWIGKERRAEPLSSWMVEVLQKYFVFHSKASRVSKLCAEGSDAVRALLAEQRKVNCLDLKIEDVSVSEIPLMDDDWYRSKQDEMRWKQRLSISTSKILPKFCHLHDPLAVWVAGELEKNQSVLADWFRPVRVTAAGENGELRGLIVSEDDYESRSPDIVPRSWRAGTKVYYLDPTPSAPGSRGRRRAGFLMKDYARFIADLFSACGWTPSEEPDGLLSAFPRSTEILALRCDNSPVAETQPKNSGERFTPVH